MSTPHGGLEGLSPGRHANFGSFAHTSQMLSTWRLVFSLGEGADEIQSIQLRTFHFMSVNIFFY